MPQRIVVVFEDKPAERKSLKDALITAFGDRAIIKAFDPCEPQSENTYENLIVEYFKKENILIDDIALIVTDRDL